MFQEYYSETLNTHTPNPTDLFAAVEILQEEIRNGNELEIACRYNGIVAQIEGKDQALGSFERPHSFANALIRLAKKVTV